jgi:hypothetical protein
VEEIFEGRQAMVAGQFEMMVVQTRDPDLATKYVSHVTQRSWPNILRFLFRVTFPRTGVTGGSP